MPRSIPSALRVAAVGLVVLAALPVVYVLSAGPVGGLVARKVIPLEAYQIYRPLIRAIPEDSELWRPFDWYMQFWLPDDDPYIEHPI